MREFVRFLDDCFDGLVVPDIECFGYDGGYITYYFPDSLAYGQLHGILTYILEQSADRFIIGESSGSGEYIVLNESDCGMSNLSREVAGLAFSETEILLAVLEYHLNRPSHCIKLISLVEVKRSVSGKDSAPRGIFAAAYIKQAYGHIFNERVHDNIMAAVSAAVLHALGSGRAPADDGFGRKSVSVFIEGEPHAPFSHFNHTEIMAFDSSCLDETYDILAGKPTVGQQIIKSKSVLDGSADHFLEQFDFAPGIILHALGGGTILVALLLKPAVEFGRRHGMIAILPRFSDKLEINDHLTLSVAYGKYQRLESKYHSMSDMAENAAYHLGMDTSLGIIGVIDNQADRTVGMVGTDRNFAPKLTGDMVHDLAPIETVVVDKPIKHIPRGAA